tara:strand:+ start:31 stop:546 length:516 start_codon:yes stop_codon:yes gene_type:complete
MMTKEERVAYNKQYYEDNKKERAVYRKQYYEDNKKELLAYNKQYYEDNKEKRAVYDKQYREDNKEKRRAAAKQYHANNKEEIANKRYACNLEIFEYKGGECAHCKLREPDHLEIYDYHHIDPSTKSYTVSKIIHGPMDRLIAEVDKCLLLCSNCHRKEHARLNKEQLNEII